MRSRSRSLEARAERLLRVYPRTWRARYGDEFAQLLIDDLAERRRSWRRTADVIRAGVRARASEAGLGGDLLEPTRQLRASLAATACAAIVFAAIAVGVWSQLTVDWQWSAPAAPATSAGMYLITGALAVLAAVALLAAVPLAWSAAASALHGDGRQLLQPIAVSAVGLLILVAGSTHFGHGWPGTGGRHWSDHGLVPGVIGRFCWAATLWITSYWAHPSALASFPSSELAWMLASPAALAATLIGAALLVRRLPLSARVLRYEVWLARTGALAMAAVLGGAASWAISGGPGPRRLFGVGVIDGVGIGAMAAALLLAFRALQRVPALNASDGSRT